MKSFRGLIRLSKKCHSCESRNLKRWIPAGVYPALRCGAGMTVGVFGQPVIGCFLTGCFVLGLILLAGGTSYASDQDAIELVYSWVTPQDEIEQEVYQTCLERFGENWGNYYYSCLKYYQSTNNIIASLKDIINQKSVAHNHQQLIQQIKQLPPNFYINGQRASLADYNPLNYPGYQEISYQVVPPRQVAEKTTTAEDLLKISEVSITRVGPFVSVEPPHIIMGRVSLAATSFGQTATLSLTMVELAETVGLAAQNILIIGGGIGLAFIAAAQETEPSMIPPEPSFVINPPSGCAKTTVFEVDASGSFDIEDYYSDIPLQYRWDWENDGNWDTPWTTAAIATHTYVIPDTWTIKLGVKDSTGLTASTTRDVLVTPNPPKASFTVTPLFGTTETVFEVDASDSSDIEDDEASLPLWFRWDWENNEEWDTPLTTTVTASHVFTSTGTWTIKLEVMDSDGMTGSITREISVGAPLADTAWPKFQYDLRQTGCSPYVVIDPDTEKWACQVGAATKSSPAIGADGTIYLGCNNARLYAFKSIGMEKWSYLTGDRIVSSPALDDSGTIYVGSWDGNLYAINDDGDQGSVKWTYTTGASISSSPTIGPGGTIYIGSDDMNLYAITQDGELKWAYPTNGRIKSTPAIAPDGTIYITSYDYRLYAVNPDGTEKWVYTTLSKIDSSPTIGPEGTIYFGGIDPAQLYAVNPDGTEKWIYDAPKGEILGSPAIAPDGVTIFFGVEDAIGASLFAVTDMGTYPSEKWTKFPGVAITSSPAVDANGTVFVTCDDGKLLGYLLGGSFAGGYYPIGDLGPGSSPVIGSDGTIYFGTAPDFGPAKLYAIGSDPADIRLTKKANKQRVSIGDVITYKVTISNVDVDTATSISLIDRIPTGFKYVKGSTLLDNVKQPDPNGANTPTLSFALPNVNPGKTKVLSYQLVVGSGVTFGKYQNKATCYYYDWAPTVQKTSNAKETVLVVPDPLFDLGTIIGKVFDDKNGNGIQDQGEAGIKDAQIVTEEGIIVTTDQHGRYHIPGVAPGTHLLKLQVTSDKRQVTTPVQARVVRVTEGLLCKVNFGISSEYASAGIRSSESPNSPPQRGEARPTKLGGELSTPNSITLVLLGDAELGYSKIDKDRNADLDMHADNDARFDKGWYNKGRLAGYLKGTIKNKYLITSSLDTRRTRYSELPAPKGRGSPNEVGWRTPNSELHRYIDPDKYYPTYGDESTVSFDATNTQGPLYLKVETLPAAHTGAVRMGEPPAHTGEARHRRRQRREAGLGKSSLLWGNYATGINETQLATYNRTLYGAKVSIEHRAKSKEQRAKSKEAGSTPYALRSTLFAAQAYQLAAHNEFRATGGSFYYLKHQDVVEGSEQVRIEVRDKITHLPLSTNYEQRTTGYEIDYSNGRIIFKHPVSSIQASDTIISTNILNGNPVYVIVDYEYRPDRLHLSRGTYGARVIQHLKSSIQVGATYVKEEESNKDYELKGVDTALELPYHTKLTGEYAESVARGIPSHISLDGGLSFSDLISAPTSDGSAYHIRTQTKVDEATQVRTYYQQMQAGFTSSNIMTQQGTKKYGGSISIEHPEWLSGRSTLRYDAQELLHNPNTVSSALVGGDKTGVTSLQTTYQKDRLTLTGEYRYQKVKGITSETNQDTCLPSRRDRQASLGAVRANYQLTESTNVFLGQQGTFKGDANYQTTAGASAQITDFLATELQGTSGTQGNSLLLALRSRPMGGETQVYTNIGYQMIRGSDYQGEKQTSVATGLTSQITSQTRVYAQESRTYFGKVCAGRTSSSATAVGQETRLLEKLRIGCNFERGLINNFDGTDTVRKSGSITLGYQNETPRKYRGGYQVAAGFSLRSKLEARLDESTEDKEQYLFGNNVKYQLTEDLTLLGRANWSRTDNKTTEQTDALFREYGIGLALRPVKWDKLNLLGKYTYLVDNKPKDQMDPMDITKERANVYALEGAYDISPYFQVVEKYAVKDGEEKVAGYDWVDSRTTLWLNRLNYHLLDSWTVGLEYRILTQDLADDRKQGFLVEAIYKINQYVQLGAGYNFTDFTDDLINEADYSVCGPFIRILTTLTK